MVFQVIDLMARMGAKAQGRNRKLQGLMRVSFLQSFDHNRFPKLIICSLCTREGK